MESQGAPQAAAGPGDARDSQDHGETSRLSSFSSSHSSPQASASFRSDRAPGLCGPGLVGEGSAM
eukprot:352048-Chlamydomonas_euryale.AAC.11